MAEGYWRYSDPRVAAPPPVSGAASAAAAAVPPSSSAPLKRPRPDYAGEKLPDWRYSDHRAPPGAAAVAPPPADTLKRSRAADYDVPGGRDLPPYFPSRDEDRAGYRIVRDTEPIGASYDRYLRNGLSSTAAPELSRGGGIGGYPLEERRVVSARQEAAPLPLPPDATNTLYVEGLPSNCTRREVSHIFRPFVGYREVRLVNKEPKHKEGSTHILCFVDFASPAHAAVALDALQGYRLDEHDRDSSVLRLQFTRNPGLRSSASRSRRS
ncbi:RNA-binding protein 1 [Rhynchospora pubera]|uniref:RNA-binding protein 1 n=1 Tax=Rhynchospora pubera TaxID=906938 RepID=A0AAV8GDU5_9POAL|nr:RNA-binding protein 1 [Rhynchospora pubera]